MKNTFRDIIKPVLVLTCICLVITSLLAYINTVTSPIIAKAEAEAEQNAMTEVLPEADTFKQLEIENAPERIDKAYVAENGAGYVFMLSSKGYSSTKMKLICAVNPDGEIEACKTLSHSETSGLGSKTVEDPYRSQYNGKTLDTLNEVDAISGATISSNAYKSAIEDALRTFDMIKGAEK